MNTFQDRDDAILICYRSINRANEVLIAEIPPRSIVRFLSIEPLVSGRAIERRGIDVCTSICTHVLILACLFAFVVYQLIFICHVIRAQQKRIVSMIFQTYSRRKKDETRGREREKKTK